MKINRKKIIISVFIIVLVLVGIWFFGILNKSEQQDIANETRNLFPFGEINIGNQGKNNPQNQGTQGNNNTQETGETVVEPEIPAGPRLRQITDFPTGGFAPIIRTEDKEITDISINSLGETEQVVKTIQVENTYVRYGSILDATIYETKLTPSSLTDELLVENFIPNVEYIDFSENGDNALFRYWNRGERLVETYLGKLKKKELNIKKCPFDFSKNINLGDESSYVFQIHEFLNKTPQTRVSVTGINSPGNEGSLAVVGTITSIKNFQSLYGLDIDGALGPATQTKMLELCDLEQKHIAEEIFNNLKTKYDISGFFLPQGIVDISISPDGKEFFYLQEDTVGVVGIIRNFIDNTKRTLFESPYTEWLTTWNNLENIEITTKASYQSDGYSYYLTPTDGDYHKSFKQRNGLTTLASPDNRKVFIHEILNDSVRNSIYDRAGNRMRPLTIQTFPEKCAWSHDSSKIYCAIPDALAYGNEYPDVWYQGLETYHDSLWEINARTLRAEVLSDLPTEYQKNIDIVKIGVDKNSEYLYFVDKNSEFLWSYRLQDF